MTKNANSTASSCCVMFRLVCLHMAFMQKHLTAPSVLQMPVFRAIKQWRAGQPAGSPGLLFNLLMMVRLEHLQGDALHQLLQDELIRADVQCSQLVAHAALQIAGTATDHFPCRPVRSFAQVQIQVSRQVAMLPDTCMMILLLLWIGRMQAINLKLRSACGASFFPN